MDASQGHRLTAILRVTHLQATDKALCIPEATTTIHMLDVVMRTSEAATMPVATFKGTTLAVLRTCRLPLNRHIPLITPFLRQHDTATMSTAHRLDCRQ